MCVFCEIVKGNIPSRKVYEDDEILAILDIAQTTKGHTLVMPKKHYTDIYESDPEILKKLIVKVQELGKMICENLGEARPSSWTTLNWPPKTYLPR